MKPPERFITTRLFLRPPSLKDAIWMFEGYAQDPQVTRYLSWRPHRDVAETTAFLQRCVMAWDKSTAYSWIITKRASGEALGMLETRINGKKVELGYVLRKNEWGNGYMPEAVAQITKWALQQAAFHRVWAVCDVDNYASLRVLEKAGLQREGILRRWIENTNLSPVPRDGYCYAKVKEG